MSQKTTADLALAELEEAASELLKHGEHEGDCTNRLQVSLASSIPPCKKHLSALKEREERFKHALDQFKLLRDVFGSLGDGAFLQP
jgi:hypothetical protein